jgi:uncharacterized radical SAM superfamily Fe-S cluster-containing enzyme
MKSHLLKGEFDLHITDFCNLHCDGCIVLDYQQSGQVTNQKLSLKDIKDIIWELESRKLRLEQLKILGGEPTLHNELDNIIDYIKSSQIADKLTLITNGLNLTDKIIESLSELDSLVISEYPIPNVLSIEKVFNISQVKTKLTSNGVDVIFWRQDEFELYGVEQQGIEYNSELNWKGAFKKIAVE